MENIQNYASRHFAIMLRIICEAEVL